MNRARGFNHLREVQVENFLMQSWNPRQMATKLAELGYISFSNLEEVEDWLKCFAISIQKKNALTEEVRK